MKTETPLRHQSALDIPLHDLRQELGEAKWNSTFAHSHLYMAKPHDSATPADMPHSFVLAVPNAVIRDKIVNRHIADLQQLIARRIRQPEESIVLEVRVAEETGTGEYQGPADYPGPANGSASRFDAPSGIASFNSPTRLSEIDMPVHEQSTHISPDSPPEISSETASGSWSRPSMESIRPGSRFTFDNFVSGSTNRFAYQAALAVAETPGTAYNPLFIFGNVGLGKTHLLQAITHFVKAHYPEKNVRYMATETFLNDFLTAIRNKQNEQFRQRYRKLDILTLDDIQILEGKEALQEELFHTFNHMYDQNKQLIFSSDRPPDALLTLQDRLRSRFKSGLLTDIQPPSIEVRLAILKQNVEQHNARRDQKPPILIPENALMFIAENFTENIRELEGALTKVIAHAQLLRIPPTYESATEILGDFISHDKSEKLTAQDIIHLATEFFSLPAEELLGPCRTKNLVTARHITMYALREHTDLSLPIIGGLFDGRDHTSVLHAVNKITEKMQTDNTIHSQVLHLTNQITRGKAPV